MIDDDATEPPRETAHPANRLLLQEVANCLIAAREHATRLRMIYRLLRDLPHAASGHYGELFLEEQSRHYKRMGEQLDKLREQIRNAKL